MTYRTTRAWSSPSRWGICAGRGGKYPRPPASWCTAAGKTCSRSRLPPHSAAAAGGAPGWQCPALPPAGLRRVPLPRRPAGAALTAALRSRAGPSRAGSSGVRPRGMGIVGFVSSGGPPAVTDSPPMRLGDGLGARTRLTGLVPAAPPGSASGARATAGRHSSSTRRIGQHGEHRRPDGDGRRRVLPKDQHQHSDSDDGGFEYPPVAGQPELPWFGLAAADLAGDVVARSRQTVPDILRGTRVAAQECRQGNQESDDEDKAHAGAQRYQECLDQAFGRRRGDGIGRNRVQEDSSARSQGPAPAPPWPPPRPTPRRWSCSVSGPGGQRLSHPRR